MHYHSTLKSKELLPLNLVRLLLLKYESIIISKISNNRIQLKLQISCN